MKKILLSLLIISSIINASSQSLRSGYLKFTHVSGFTFSFTADIFVAMIPQYHLLSLHLVMVQMTRLKIMDSRKSVRSATVSFHSVIIHIQVKELT